MAKLLPYLRNENLLQVTLNGEAQPTLRVRSATGQEVELPEGILRLLQQLVPQLAPGERGDELEFSPTIEDS